MQFFNSLLIFFVSLALFATAQPIASASAPLEKRGIGWSKGANGKFRCERHANPFFEKYHLQGQTTYFGEEELKDTVKSVGVMTEWKFEDFGEGKFDAKVSILAFGFFFEMILDNLDGGFVDMKLIVSGTCLSGPIPS
jgi:hypothetical protein